MFSVAPVVQNLIPSAAQAAHTDIKNHEATRTDVKKPDDKNNKGKSQSRPRASSPLKPVINWLKKDLIRTSTLGATAILGSNFLHDKFSKSGVPSEVKSAKPKTASSIWDELGFNSLAKKDNPKEIDDEKLNFTVKILSSKHELNEKFKDEFLNNENSTDEKVKYFFEKFKKNLLYFREIAENLSMLLENYESSRTITEEFDSTIGDFIDCFKSQTEDIITKEMKRDLDKLEGKYPNGITYGVTRDIVVLIEKILKELFEKTSKLHDTEEIKKFFNNSADPEVLVPSNGIQNSQNQQAQLNNRTVFLGDTDSGKTALWNIFLKKDFPLNTNSTIGAEYLKNMCVMDNREIIQQIWDTSGQEKFRNITESFVISANFFVFTISLENENFQKQINEIEQFFEMAKERISKNNAKGIVVMTKADLDEGHRVETNNAIEQIKSVIENFSNKNNIQGRITLFETPVSAKNGDNIEALKAEIKNKVKETTPGFNSNVE